MNEPTVQGHPTCLNCKAPLPDHARYCPVCGQKRTTGRVTVGQLMQEFINSVFNLNSKIFVSLAALIIPGKLTTAYFKGKHKTYVHPIRLFLVTTILLIAIISFKASIDDDIDLSKILGVERNYQAQILQHRVDSVREIVYQQYSSKEIHTAIDTFAKQLIEHDSLYQDSVYLDQHFNLYGERSPVIANSDFMLLNPDELIEKYKIDGLWNQMLFRQKLKFINNSTDFFRYMIGRISWIVFIMIPLFSLVLKLFYSRKKYYYVEHLIFSIHVHSFLFLLMALMVLLEGLLSEWLAFLVTFIGLAYIFLALKNFYQDSLLLTIIKFILLSVGYLIVMVISIMTGVVLGFFLF